MFGISYTLITLITRLFIRFMVVKVIPYLMHKERYLTSENAEEKVNFWLSSLARARGRRKVIFGQHSGRSAALLVIDMQRYFTHADSHAFVPSADVAIQNINRLVECFNTELVVYTRHIDAENSIMLKWWESGLFKDNPLSEIDARIKLRGKVVSKHTYSAFYKTKLETLLKKNHIERVYITGLLTNLCCETTARDAFVHGYEVFLIADATATYNEQLHFATLLNLSHGFARVVSTKEVLGGK